MIQFAIALQRCDKNGDGQIGPDELVEMAKALNLSNLSSAQAKVLVDCIDQDGDGKINEDGRQQFSDQYFITLILVEFLRLIR